MFRKKTTSTFVGRGRLNPKVFEPMTVDISDQTLTTVFRSENSVAVLGRALLLGHDHHGPGSTDGPVPHDSQRTHRHQARPLPPVRILAHLHELPPGSGALLPYGHRGEEEKLTSCPGLVT